MQIGRLTKALLVTIAAGLWLVQGQPSVGRTIVFVLGAALVTWWWITLTPPRRMTAGRIQAPAPVAPLHRHSADRRIERKPRGRIARDVRCPASRATARARRSTRR